MSEIKPWDEAVADAAVSPQQSPLRAIREELESLWSDLDREHRNALNSFWSVGCTSCATRIVRLSRIAGVTRPGRIPLPLLLNGIYQGLLTSAGLAFDAPDMARTEAMATGMDYTRCAECGLWSGAHVRECSLRSRTAHERDQERLRA